MDPLGQEGFQRRSANRTARSNDGDLATLNLRSHCTIANVPIDIKVCACRGLGDTSRLRLVRLLERKNKADLMHSAWLFQGDSVTLYT